MTTKEWKALFDKVNEDCAKTGESVVPYSDVNYYASQVDNLTNNEDYDEAFVIAIELANYKEQPCTIE